MDRPTQTRGQTPAWSGPIAGINESPTARHGRFIGRVGALAVLLGVGTALAVPGVAVADTGDASSSGSTSSASSSSTSGSDKSTSRATKTADSKSDTTKPNRATTSRSASESSDDESDTTDSDSTAPSDPESTDSEDVSDPDSSLDPSDEVDVDADDEVVDEVVGEVVDEEIVDPDEVVDEEIADPAEAEAEDSNDRTAQPSTADTNTDPAVTPTDTDEEQPTEIVDVDESDPAESPTTDIDPAQAGVAAVLPDPVSIPVSNDSSAAPAKAAVLMSAQTDASEAGIPADTPVSNSLAVALLAWARRYETPTADAASTTQSTATVLAGATGSALFTSPAAFAPERTFLQYTFAAVGEVFKSILRNPLQAVFDPIGTGLYVVKTVIRGLMTDIGLAPTNPLATRDAIAIQREAAALVATPEVQAARQATLDFLMTTPLATTSLGAAANRAILEKVVDEYVMAVALGVVSDSPANPRITPGTYLGARYGMDNPDNAYRGFNVDGNSTYVITGNTNTAKFISFQVVNGYYGESGQTPPSAGVIDTTTLQTDEHGNFTITLGQDPADGRPNYIQLTPDAKQVIIRDTFSDWTQTAATLSVERVAGPDLPAPPTFQQQTERLANWIVTGAPYWHAFSNAYRQVPVNTVTPAIPTPGGLAGQSSALGHYALTEDQALVVTIRPYDADYVGFQVGTDWFTSIDYANHTSSMNTQQATPNADGSFTYVVSLKDPGVANWIDPAGHPTGLLQVRWQGLATGAMPPGYKPTVQLVSFDELSTVLPPETVMVTERQRQRQIDQRRAQLRERFFGIPARLVAFDLRTFEPLF